MYQNVTGWAETDEVQNLKGQAADRAKRCVQTIARVGSDRPGSDLKKGKHGSGRVGSGRVGSGRVGSGRVGSGRVEVGSGQKVFNTHGSGHPDPIRPARSDPTRENLSLHSFASTTSTTDPIFHSG